MCLGEQLKRTEGRLDEAHEHLQDAGKNLDQLEKCCGCIVIPWRMVGSFLCEVIN